MSCLPPRDSLFLYFSRSLPSSLSLFGFGTSSACDDAVDAGKFHVLRAVRDVERATCHMPRMLCALKLIEFKMQILKNSTTQMQNTFFKILKPLPAA